MFDRSSLDAVELQALSTPRNFQQLLGDDSDIKNVERMEQIFNGELKFLSNSMMLMIQGKAAN